MSSQNEKNFAKFRKQLEGLFVDLDDSAKRVVDNMANVGIRVTKGNTPVNRNPKVIGGTLRKGWRKNKTYKVGNSFVSGYQNNTSYALYVNNGHRIVKNGVTVGFVKGRLMLEKGTDEARRQTHSLFENEIARVKRKTGF